ncbi:hypothetical protein, partial [Pseudomonas syringae group genomosp. 7]|uniref:hypothetical protein n=1 Tax=Pseudomonas syringae group genomosp. 7 TaxID=251699 RepID=UPI00376F849B
GRAWIEGAAAVPVTASPGGVEQPSIGSALQGLATILQRPSRCSDGGAQRWHMLRLALQRGAFGHQQPAVERRASMQ